jgi:hypothetical protein
LRITTWSVEGTIRAVGALVGVERCNLGMQKLGDEDDEGRQRAITVVNAELS